MNRRSFFGFFPATLAGVVLGVPAVKSAWGEGIPPILKKWGALHDETHRFWRSVELHVDRCPPLGEYIDSRLRIDVERLAKVQEKLAQYPPTYTGA